jgi:hypothetical protein
MIILKDSAWDTVNLDIKHVPAKTMTPHSQDLATSRVALSGINGIDSSDSLSFVASRVIITTMKHRMLHMHCVSNTESEVYLNIVVRGDTTHYTALLNSLPTLQPGICFDEPLEIDTVAVQADFDPGQFRQCGALPILSTSYVDPESDL